MHSMWGSYCMGQFCQIQVTNVVGVLFVGGLFAAHAVPCPSLTLSCGGPVIPLTAAPLLPHEHGSGPWWVVLCGLGVLWAQLWPLPVSLLVVNSVKDLVTLQGVRASKNRKMGENSNTIEPTALIMETMCCKVNRHICYRTHRIENQSHKQFKCVSVRSHGKVIERGNMNASSEGMRLDYIYLYCKKVYNTNGYTIKLNISNQRDRWITKT